MTTNADEKKNNELSVPEIKNVNSEIPENDDKNTEGEFNLINSLEIRL